MLWPFNNTTETKYWLKVFGLYALVEASIQLMFLIIVNKFGGNRISIAEFHVIMLLFQCILIWPIWWVAYAFRKQSVFVQIVANIVFYIGYSYLWFGPVQDVIGYLYNHVQQITRAEWDRQEAYLDRGYEYSYLNYQLLKHAFRLSWFYLAAYFYNFRKKEQERIHLAVANKELQLKMLKWHLNPSFYFKTINYLQQVAKQNPVSATGPILQLAKVMEYVIYETREQFISIKKEIRFLVNYVQLINEQNGNDCFEITVDGEHEHLRIAPLLLTGIIDKLVAERNTQSVYKMNFSFHENMMLLTIEGANAEKKLFHDEQDETHRRLSELYPGRFTISHSNNIVITILLDEE